MNVVLIVVYYVYGTFNLFSSSKGVMKGEKSIDEAMQVSRAFKKRSAERFLKTRKIVWTL